MEFGHLIVTSAAHLKSCAGTTFPAFFVHGQLSPCDIGERNQCHRKEDNARNYECGLERRINTIRFIEGLWIWWWKIGNHSCCFLRNDIITTHIHANLILFGFLCGVYVFNIEKVTVRYTQMIDGRHNYVRPERNPRRNIVRIRFCFFVHFVQGPPNGTHLFDDLPVACARTACRAGIAFIDDNCPTT